MITSYEYTTIKGINMSLTEEKSNFLRFYFLNLKVATKAVRVYFDSIYPPAGLAQELKNNQSHLQSLKFLNASQKQTLYPASGMVKSDQFDTTLMICLLRNMKPCMVGPDPATGWDNFPQPADTCCNADLVRVKWYRNYMSHHTNGKLLKTDFSKYWGDLEQVIKRLGGPSMHIETQSAQHVILDTSLKDMLLKLRYYEKSLQEQSSKINNQQSAIDSLKTSKEVFQKEADQLIVSHQELEDKTQTLTNTISDYKETIDACSKKIETCKNDIKKNEEIIKELQDQSLTKQNGIDDLITQIGKLEIKYEHHDEIFIEHRKHLLMHDGQIETFEKSIDDMRQKLHDTDDTSNKSKQQKMEDDTDALIAEDLREGTFVTTRAVTDGLLLLKQNGVLLITGYAGTGKSRIGRHVLHMFCTGDTSYKCIKVNTLEEWDDMVSREEHVAVLIDDIFGETNCIYNRKKDTPILDKVHAYVCKGNIKVIITIRDTVKRQCQEVFESHRLFQFDCIDLSSNNYVLSREEKNTILTKYMKTVRQSDYTDNKGFLDNNSDTILNEIEVLRITYENPVKGFPLVVYQFVHNDKYFHLGSKFFDRPTEEMLEEMFGIRQKGEDDRMVMIQYAVMVYTAINKNRLNLDDISNITEIPKIIEAIYGVPVLLKKCHISNAVKKIKGSYLVNIPNQRSYKLHHPTLQESVILSFAQMDEDNINKIIPLISWSFFLKMVKPELYIEKEGEVVLRVPTKSYKILADRLVGIYMAKFRTNIMSKSRCFISSLSKTEIFQQEYFRLIPSLLDAFDNEDKKDKYTENMIQSVEDKGKLSTYLLHMKNKDNFLANLLNALATLEEQFDTYKFVLEELKTLTTSRHQVTIDYMRFTLISSLYNICSTKDLSCVKATFEIIDDKKIPVLLDQCVKISILPNIAFRTQCLDELQYVYLVFCIWNAYEVFNLPVLEFLLSKYVRNPFDINLFFKMIYSDKGNGLMITSLKRFAIKRLKWMIETFTDQELDDPDLILRTACKHQMFDTVEYLASKCKTFDAFSCLQAFVDKPDELLFDEIPFKQKLFNYLIKKIDITSSELIPVVRSVIQKLKHDVPDYVFDAFLPVCLDDTSMLTLACENGQFYLVKLIIENSNIKQLDIQSALMAACKDQEIEPLCFIFNNNADVEAEKIKIVKYMVEKIGFEQVNLKPACQQAFSSQTFQTKEKKEKKKEKKGFVRNIDTNRLDVYTIIDSAIIYKKSHILEHIIKNIELESLDKRKVLNSVTQHYTAKCSTTILEIVRTFWYSTHNKEVLHMEEIVNTAYERKCFELLMWIHENCHPYIAIDSKKVLMLACEDFRVDVAKWALKICEKTSLKIDGGKLFMLVCSKTFYLNQCNVTNKYLLEMARDMIGTLNWILATFQIKQFDILSGVLDLISGKYGVRDNLYSLVVSILEKYLRNLTPKDMKAIIDKSLELTYYDIVNWFLENESSFDKQKILNKACADAEIRTVQLVRKYFYCLDMNQAMYHAFNARDMRYEFYCMDLKDCPIFICLEILWKEIDHDSIDISSIVSTICQEQNNNSKVVMTWILLNLPHDRIPVNEVLIKCCQQWEINHVKFIFHKVDNEQLDINEALLQACSVSHPSMNARVEGLCVVEFLFQKLHDKTSSLPKVLEGLICKKNFDLILYFLQAGYYRNIDMKHLMNLACTKRHIGLLQWILANIQHKELDFKSAFRNAWEIGPFEFISIRDGMQLQCVALMWHYMQDINMFEIEAILKPITESQPDLSYPDSDDYRRTLLLYIKNIAHRNDM